MKKYKNELSLGIFVLIASALLAFMTVSVGKFNFGKTTRVEAIFSSAAGIVKNSDVLVSGVPVGHIGKISLQENKAVMQIIIDEKVKISRNVKAVIRAKSLLGEKYVELVPDSGKDYLRDGDIIKNTQAPAEIDQLVAALSPLIMKMGPLLEKIDPEEILSIFKTFAVALRGKEEQISRIINNTDLLFGQLATNRKRIDRIVVSLENITGTTDLLLRDKKNHIERIVPNIAKISEALAKNPEKLLKNLDLLTADLAIISADLRKNVPELAQNLQRLSADLLPLVKELQKNSPELAQNLTGTLKEMNSLLLAVKKQSPDLLKDLGIVTSELAKISGELGAKSPKIIENTDEVLARLAVTLKKLEPLLSRLESFDEEKVIKRLEKTMRENGIKVHLF